MKSGLVLPKDCINQSANQNTFVVIMMQVAAAAASEAAACSVSRS